jgi:5'-nucleotidase
MADLVVRDLGGIRVGLFSLTLDDEPAPWLAYGFDLAARRATVAESIRRLKDKGATLILPLTHQSLDQDEWLAREFPEIPLILGGHEHIAIDRTLGKTRIVKADADAKTVVRIDVRRSSTGFEITPRWLTLDGAVEPDPQVAAYTTAAIARMGSALRRATGRAIDTVYGSTEGALEGLETAIRTRETALGSFLADVLRQRLGAQIGFLNGGAVRINDDIPGGGRITEYELEGIFYFDNKPAGFELTGQELYELLAKSISQPDLGHGRFLQVSGLRFRYHVHGQGFDRTYTMAPDDVEIGTLETGFVPLDLKARYTVASLDYIWENGYRDGYPLFSKGNPNVGTSPPRFDDPKKPLSWRKITEEAIAALPENRVTTKIEGRIVRVEEQ